ncbi:MAG: hypothetical protein ACE5GT_10940 [Rhodospirillales bacterium]
MNWVKAGLAWGGGITLVTIAILGALFWFSESDNIAEFETAAGAAGGLTASGEYVVPLTPYKVQVKSAGAKSIVQYVNVRVVIIDEGKKRYLCGRIPLVMEALDMAIGGKSLSEAEWQQLASSRFAANLRWHINRRLKADHVARVIIDRGRASQSRVGGCTP